VASGFGRHAFLHAIQQRLPLHSHRYRCAESMYGLYRSRPRAEIYIATAIAKIFRNNEKRPKNLQTNRGKEFYNANMQKLLKKHNINYFDVFCNEGLNCRTVQSYEEWHVETVYTQWKL